MRAFLLGVIVLATPAAANECLQYEEPVTLSGYYGSAVFPGPPEYESVTNGDAPERAAIIFLVTPICVEADREGFYEAVPATGAIQLVCPPVQVTQFEITSGDLLTVNGKLFGAHTGHHHTRVLLRCE